MAASCYSALRGDVANFLVDSLGSFLADSLDGRTAHAGSGLLGQQMTKAFEQYYAIKLQLETQTIDCAIMAITKSGKSTLINAAVGASVLPSNNIPETARVVSIEHTALAKNQEPYLTYKVNEKPVRVEGVDEIYSHLEYCNRDVRSRPHRKGDEQMLAINMCIAALPSGEAEQQCKLRLLDTPGTNEANEERLRHSVERLLDSVDAVLYILDYTKLKTSEEANLLATLKEVNPVLTQRLSKRLFFVVNKIDCMHSSVGLKEDELCEYVADLITKQMNSPAFQLGPEQVMLVSAHEALLARLVMTGKATKEEQRMFALKAWGSSWARKRQQKSAEEMQKQAECMLEDSRLPELEDRLFSYLYSNAAGLKLMSLLDNMSRLLNEVHNGASTGLAALKQTASELVKESADLQHSLDGTMDKFDTVQRQAGEIELEVTENVQARMQTLKERIFAHVNEVLGEVEEPALPAVKSGPWRKAWEKATRFLRRSNGEAQSDHELREKLQELHEDINAQISNEIQQFWRDLEVATNEKQRHLVAVLNQHLDTLARSVEQCVGAALNLRLEPITMKLDPPSLEEFHHSIQDLFQRGIGRNVRVEKQSREETSTHWEARYRGLCKTTQYYVAVPVKHTVEYDHEIVTFQPNKEAIEGHFQDMVESSVSASSKYVRGYVHAYLSDSIEAARAKISAYGKLYSDWMSAALQLKAQSLEEQDASAKALEARVEAVADLLAKCAVLQDRAAHLVPDAKPDDPFEDLAGLSLDHEVTFDAAADTEADALPEDSEGEALQRGAVTTENEVAEQQQKDLTEASTQRKDQGIEAADTNQELALAGLDRGTPEAAVKEQPKNAPSLPLPSETMPSTVSGSPAQPAAAGVQPHAAQKTEAVPFWDLQGGWQQTPVSSVGLPVSQPSGAEGDGHRLDSSAKASAGEASESVPPVLRQDSLDSSDWECLSHEHYLEGSRTE